MPSEPLELDELHVVLDRSAQLVLYKPHGASGWWPVLRPWDHALANGFYWFRDAQRGWDREKGGFRTREQAVSCIEDFRKKCGHVPTDKS